MDPLWVGIIGVVVLLGLLFSGIYVAVALGVVGVAGMVLVLGFDPAMSLLATTAFHYGTEYVFIVIPLFVAMGLFASEGGISRDAYDALAKWVGKVKGGLGLATIGACAIFGTLTGSSVVTAVVFAKVSVPEMRRHGYNAKISYGLVSAAGAIGLLIPPNLLAVVYALITEQSLGQLLMGGIGPGIVLALCLGLGLVGMLAVRPSLGPASGSGAAISWGERLAALPKLWPALVVAAIMIVGVYAGIFTVTEASGIGTFVLLILYFAVKGISRQSWQILAASLREAVSLTAMILLILVAAQVFARLLVLSRLGPMLADFVTTSNLSPFQFMLAAVLLYLILGALIDSVSTIAITVPIFYPIVQAMGIDPIWFATTMILATQVGIVTPPFALAVFAVKTVADPDVSLEDIFRGSMPFLVLMLVALALVIAFPDISTWIPYNMWKP